MGRSTLASLLVLLCHCAPHPGSPIPRSAPPPLRSEVLLDGTWDFIPLGQPRSTIAVPEFWDAAPGFVTARARYERRVTVPASWAGKRIRVEFLGVNHVANVYVGGTRVGSHVGGWTPFGFDVTSLVRPGHSFLLAVDVRGGSSAPIVDSAGYPAWPVGWYGHEQQWGIGDDVYLRAYGPAYIADAFIETSWRSGTLTVTYALRNADTLPHSVAVQAAATRAGVTALTLAGPVVPLAAGEARKVRISVPWANPAPWTPDAPALYLLESRLVEGGRVLDRETRRFGFREFWVEDDHFMLNGVRLNLRGTSITAHAQGFRDQRYRLLTRAAWPATIDSLKSLNVGVLRFHQQPPPSFVLDVADEKGLLVIAESAVYARDYLYTSDKATYVRNSGRWIVDWVRGERNHPSIVLWSASNEMKHPFGLLGPEQIRSLGDSIAAHDSTRPVIYEGERDDIGGAVVSYHYPEGYLNRPSVSGYSLGYLVRADKPTGVGELLASYGPDGEANRWWQGTWIRGLRYAGFADLRPYTTEWALSRSGTPQAANLRNGLSPVALFDKAYDELGIVPLAAGHCPPLTAGQPSHRTLVLYNDDYADTTVTVEVTTRIGAATDTTLSRAFAVGLGEHITIPYLLEVPEEPGTTLDMVLVTRKGGVERFRETKCFSVE